MPGAERLGKCQELMSLLEQQRESGRIWSAICAAPAVVFEPQGWLKGKKATCHPAFVERLADGRCAQHAVTMHRPINISLRLPSPSQPS